MGAKLRPSGVEEGARDLSKRGDGEAYVVYWNAP
jgi:hypothetical protein